MLIRFMSTVGYRTIACALDELHAALLHDAHATAHVAASRLAYFLDVNERSQTRSIRVVGTTQERRANLRRGVSSLAAKAKRDDAFGHTHDVEASTAAAETHGREAQP